MQNRVSIRGNLIAGAGITYVCALGRGMGIRCLHNRRAYPGGIKMNRAEQITGGFALLVIIGILLVNPVSAQPITAPAKITMPGVYELTGDARGITDVYGISIECSNVVIDGGNHFLGGEGRDKSIGVYVNQYGGSITNITVKNLIIEKWQAGIDYKYVKGQPGDTNLITGCDIVDSETAIHVEYSDYVQVIDNKITDCPTGINVEGLSTYTTLQENTIKNSGLGIGVTNSRYTTVEENNINTCSVYGLQVTDCEYTTITRNPIGNNKYAAVMIENSRESDISGNTLTQTETGPVLIIGNEVRYASITDNYFGSYETVSVDEVSSEIAWNSTQAPGINILGGPYMGGNYWGSAPGDKGYSDTAPDVDGFGIADEPYQINEYNIDYLPLTHTTATKAPEDQLQITAEESAEESSVNATEEEMTEPAQEGTAGNETPVVPEKTDAAVPETPVEEAENTTAVPPLSEPSNQSAVPVNETGPVTDSPLDNETPLVQNTTASVDANTSILNSSLTNAYQADVSGDLPAVPSLPLIPDMNQSQGLESEGSGNESAPAQVGYLVFNVTQAGFQVTLTTATGTEVSLDEAEKNEMSIPVPVQGLVYSTFRVTCPGYVSVSGNISPYPAPGESVSIPVTLVPNPTGMETAVSTLEAGSLPGQSTMAEVIPSPAAGNETPLLTIQAANVSIGSANATSSSVAAEPVSVPVVVANGALLESTARGAHIIRASAGPGGSIFPTGEVEVPDAGSVAFIMDPEEGRSISYLIVDGVQTGPMSEYRFIDVTSDHSITAGFS